MTIARELATRIVATTFDDVGAQARRYAKIGLLDTVGVGIDTKRAWPQNALLTVDTTLGTLNLTPTYWVFRNFSQFVATGAKVVGTSGGDAVAFKNPDGSIVAVMYNSGSAKTMTVATAGKKLQFAMPGNGWATVVSR